MIFFHGTEELMMISLTLTHIQLGPLTCTKVNFWASVGTLFFRLAVTCLGYFWVRQWTVNITKSQLRENKNINRLLGIVQHEVKSVAYNVSTEGKRIAVLITLSICELKLMSDSRLTARLGNSASRFTSFLFLFILNKKQFKNSCHLLFLGNYVAFNDVSHNFHSNRCNKSQTKLISCSLISSKYKEKKCCPSKDPWGTPLKKWQVYILAKEKKMLFIG